MQDWPNFHFSSNSISKWWCWVLSDVCFRSHNSLSCTGQNTRVNSRALERGQDRWALVDSDHVLFRIVRRRKALVWSLEQKHLIKMFYIWQHVKLMLCSSCLDSIQWDMINIVEKGKRILQKHLEIFAAQGMAYIIAITFQNIQVSLIIFFCSYLFYDYYFSKACVQINVVSTNVRFLYISL